MMSRLLPVKRHLMIAGVLMMVAGFVFGLQSQGVVGPESSFMYKDPQWDTNGKIIIQAGVILALFAAFIRDKKNPQR